MRWVGSRSVHTWLELCTAFASTHAVKGLVFFSQGNKNLIHISTGESRAKKTALVCSQGGPTILCGTPPPHTGYSTSLRRCRGALGSHPIPLPPPPSPRQHVGKVRVLQGLLRGDALPRLVAQHAGEEVHACCIQAWLRKPLGWGLGAPLREDGAIVGELGYAGPVDVVWGSQKLEDFEELVDFLCMPDEGCVCGVDDVDHRGSTKEQHIDPIPHSNTRTASPGNSGRPLAISAKMHPTLHMSTAVV